MALTREQLLDESVLETAVVQLPIGEVIVTEISAPDYIEICELSKKDGTDTVDGTMQIDMRKFDPALLAFGIIDVEGNRVFSNDDIPLLAKRSMKKFEPALKKLKEMSGLLRDSGNESEPTLSGSISGE